MSYEITEKLRNLKPYEPISGVYPIRLDANESYLAFNSDLKGKIAEAVEGVSYNRYPDALAEDVCKAFSLYYNVGLDCVTAGNGSDELISVIISSMLQKGDTILTLEPDFSMYSFYAQMAELTVHTINKHNDLQTSVDDILKAEKAYHAKAVIFSNPCNPTSLVLNKNEVLRLIENTNMLVIVDEAYMDFSDQSILCKANKLDNVIVLKTCSKALGAAAIRLGFAVANNKITNALHAAKSPYNVNAVTQAIGVAVLGERDTIDRSVQSIIQSRDELYSGLLCMSKNKKEITRVFKPETNFVFVELKNVSDCYNKLLKQGIAVRCLGNYLRITAGTKQENAALLLALENILQ